MKKGKYLLWLVFLFLMSCSSKDQSYYGVLEGNVTKNGNEIIFSNPLIVLYKDHEQKEAIPLPPKRLKSLLKSHHMFLLPFNPHKHSFTSLQVESIVEKDQMLKLTVEKDKIEDLENNNFNSNFILSPKKGKASKDVIITAKGASITSKNNNELQLTLDTSTMEVLAVSKEGKLTASPAGREQVKALYAQDKTLPAGSLKVHRGNQCLPELFVVDIDLNKIEDNEVTLKTLPFHTRNTPVLSEHFRISSAWPEGWKEGDAFDHVVLFVDGGPWSGGGAPPMSRGD